MAADDESSGPGDWSFPPVEPAATASSLGFPTADLPSDGPAPVPEPDLGWSEVPEAVTPPPNLNVPRRTPTTGEPVSPMRAMAGALVAVAGVLLGIGALLWATEAPSGTPTVASQQQATTQVPSSPLPSPSVEPSVAPPAVAPASRVPTVTQSSPVPATRPTVAPIPKLALTVLNNSNRTLLADRAAREFRAAGWPIKLTGNFRGRISETTVYYEPGQLRSARLLQRAFPGLTRVRPRFDGLPGSGLTVVLTRSYNA